MASTHSINSFLTEKARFMNYSKVDYEHLKIECVTSLGSPVFIAYIWLKTFKASSLRFIASKNFGVSGMNAKTMALNKFISDVQVKKNRHGLYSNEKM